MEKRNSKLNLPAIAFACAALIAAVPSSALAEDRAPIEKVPYGDLNLATQAGIDTLDRRLDRAVERVCGQAIPRVLQHQKVIAQCKKETRQRVQAKRDFAIARAAGDRGLAWAGNGPPASGPVNSAK
jgi:UrcA family protein